MTGVQTCALPIFVFRKIKKGEFGQLFAELDGIKILSWFEKYNQERMQVCISNEISKAFEYTDDFERTNNSENEKTKNQQAIGLLIHEQYQNKL